MGRHISKHSHDFHTFRSNELSSTVASTRCCLAREPAGVHVGNSDKERCLWGTSDLRRCANTGPKKKPRALRGSSFGAIWGLRQHKDGFESRLNALRASVLLTYPFRIPPIPPAAMPP